MKKEKITKTFSVTASESMMRRFERLLALLHFNSEFGHSGCFAMHMDGDGEDRIKISGLHYDLGHQVDLIGNVGGDVEIATEYGYTVDDFKERTSNYSVRASASLYKNGQLESTTPKDLD